MENPWWRILRPHYPKQLKNASSGDQRTARIAERQAS